MAENPNSESEATRRRGERTSLAFMYCLGLFLAIAPALKTALLGGQQSPGHVDYGAQISAAGLFYLACVTLFHVLIRHRRGEELRIDDEGVCLRRGDRLEYDWRWDAIDDVTFQWAGQTKIIELHRGRECRPIVSQWLDAHPGELALLHEKLEPLLSRKREAMAAGPVAVPALWRYAALQKVLFGIVIVGAVLMLANLEAFDGVAVTVLGAACCAPGLLAARNRRTVGPQELVLGRQHVPLGAIRTITVQRTIVDEAWVLEGDGIKARLGPGVDVPLLCDHLLRHCPSATFHFDLQFPRSHTEAVFMPAPPGAPAELAAGAEPEIVQQAVSRVQNRDAWRAIPALSILVSVLLTAFAIGEARQRQAYQSRGLPVEATLEAESGGFRARYLANGEEQTRVFTAESAEDTWKDGSTVKLVLLPEAPQFAMPAERIDDVHVTPRTLLILWAVSALSLVLMVVTRRRRPAPPHAVGY